LLLSTNTLSAINSIWLLHTDAASRALSM